MNVALQQGAGVGDRPAGAVPRRHPGEDPFVPDPDLADGRAPRRQPRWRPRPPLQHQEVHHQQVRQDRTALSRKTRGAGDGGSHREHNPIQRAHAR